MITDVLYSLIYLVPLVLVMWSDLLSLFADSAKMPGNRILLLVMMGVALLLIALVRIPGKVKVILIASLSAFPVGTVLVTERSARRQWLTANSWIWVVLAVTATLVFLDVLIVRFRAIRLLVGALLLGILISSYWTDLIKTKAGVVAVVFLTLSIAAEELRRRRRGDGSAEMFAVRIAPFLIIGMIGLYFMPHSTKPYDWAFAKNLYKRISDRIVSLLQSFEKGDSVDDMMAFIGFSEDGSLGGNLVETQEDMMRVSMKYSMPGCLYLDGKYFTDFDGRKWTESAGEYPYVLDMLEISCRLSAIPMNQRGDYYKEESVSVTYSGQNTVYLFAPVKSYARDIRVEEGTVDHTGNELRFEKRSGYNTAYYVPYLLLNRKSTVIASLYGEGNQIEREAWEQEQRKWHLQEEAYSYDRFLRYRSELYQQAACPHAVSKAELSDEVRCFLENVTEGAESDYEKLVALESAFADFTYTTSPGALPAEVSTPAAFLDYFITEKREGYCNSFATAYVLLCQAEGIPARLVHGYIVPKSEDEVTVYNTMAHAYPEAYVKGLGWMVFEPTPSYSGSVQWEEKDSRDTPRPEKDTPKEQKEHETVPPDIKVEKSGKRMNRYVIVIPIVLSLLAVTVVLLLERRINRRRFNRLGRREKANAVCLGIMRMLRHLRLEKDECETVSEYCDRVFREKGIGLSAFSATYEKILYATTDISEEELAELEKEYDGVYQRLEGAERILVAALRFFSLC